MGDYNRSRKKRRPYLEALKNRNRRRAASRSRDGKPKQRWMLAEIMIAPIARGIYPSWEWVVEMVDKLQPQWRDYERLVCDVARHDRRFEEILLAMGRSDMPAEARAALKTRYTYERRMMYTTIKVVEELFDRRLAAKSK